MVKRYESDAVTQGYVFKNVDLDLFSAAQVTDLLEKDFIEMADEHARFYLGE